MRENLSRNYISEGQYGSLKEINKKEWRRDDYEQALESDQQILSNQEPLLKINTSTLVVYLCVLTSELARGILLPTLWLYIESMGGTKSYQGFAIGAFSLGRIVGAPLFGYLSELYGHQLPLILCNVIIMIGSTLYLFSPTVMWIILSEIILGFGAGSLGVLRSYVVETTSSSERTESLAFLTALQYAGFTVFPILGSGIVFILGSRHYLFLNKFTAPSIFLGITSSLCVVLVTSFFRSLPPNKDMKLNSLNVSCDEQAVCPTDAIREEYKDSLNGEHLECDQESNYSPPDLLLHQKHHHHYHHQQHYNYYQPPNEVESWRPFILYLGIVVNFITKGTIGVFETLVLIITTQYFGWNEVKTGVIISIFGLIGVLILSRFSVLLRYVKDYRLIPFGLVFMTVACLVLNNDYYFFRLPYNDGVMVTAMFAMIAIGYPVAHTTLIAFYSHILTSQSKQGRALGYFASVGSLGRICFPIVAGLFMDYYHHFSKMFLCLGLTLLVLFFTFILTDSPIEKLLIVTK